MLGSRKKMLCCLVLFLFVFHNAAKPLIKTSSRDCRACQTHQQRQVPPCECKDGYCTLDQECCPINDKTTLPVNTSFESMKQYMQCHDRFIRQPLYDPLGIEDAYYMVSLCPANWTTDRRFQKEIATNCSTLKHFPPASDPVTGISFRNVFCAVCHGVNISSLLVWQTRLYDCWSPSDISNTTVITLNLINSLCSKCSYIPPDHDTVRTNLQWCIPVVSKCQISNSFQQTADKPMRFTPKFYNLNELCVNGPIKPTHQQRFSSTIYKNYDCALCNGINPSDTTCWNHRVDGLTDIQRCTGPISGFIVGVF